MKYFQIQGVKIQYCIIAASLILLSIFFLVFTTEITTKSIGTLGKETQSSQKQPLVIFQRQRLSQIKSNWVKKTLNKFTLELTITSNNYIINTFLSYKITKKNQQQLGI